MANLVTIATSIIQLILKFYGLRSQSVEIEPGTVIHFWGPSKPSNKPVLLLVHGFGASGVMTWIFQVAAFSKDFSIFVPDLLFFGESVSSSPDRSPAHQAWCLARALRAVGVDRVAALVGCSYGGIVGTHMAGGDDVAVERLVLSNSNVSASESLKADMLRRVGAQSLPEIFLPETVQGLKSLLRVVMLRRFWFPDWAYRHFLEVMFGCREEKAELLKALIVKDDEYIIPNFSQKIYIIAGEEDQVFDLETVVKPTKEELGDKASLFVIKNAGHLVQIERPFLYNRILKKILKA